MLKKSYFLTIIAFVLLIGCSKEESSLSELDSLPISFSAYVSEEVQTKVSGTNWDEGDKIGVFAIENQTTLTSENIVENYNNLSFSTSGNGVFSADAQSIYYPEDGSAIDFIAYYPYKSNLVSYNYPIDVTEQVDFLYSNNLQNVDKNSSDNSLNFRRVLSKLILDITPKGDGSLEGLTIEIDGVRTKANFSLADENLNVDNNSTKKVLLSPTGNNAEKKISYLLLPSPGNTMKVTFKVANNSIYEWTIPHTLDEGKVYKYQIQLDKLGGTITPAKTYMEIPYYSSGGTAPNSFKATHMVGSLSWLNNYYAPSTLPVRNYTILFDTENHLPYWVAYPMHPMYLKSGNRTNDWDFDPIIPRKYQPNIVNNSWSISTYNRGHMLASADRNATRAINSTTFYVTNMVPQDRKMNGGVWNELEGKVRDWCLQASYDTLYVVTGSILPPKGEITYTTDKHGMQVAVPKYLYKALLRQEKSTKKWYSIAFKMENKSNGSSYRNTAVSVYEIEQETGFTFFPNVPDAEKVKKQKDLSHWN